MNAMPGVGRLLCFGSGNGPGLGPYEGRQGGPGELVVVVAAGLHWQGSFVPEPGPCRGTRPGP